MITSIGINEYKIYSPVGVYEEERILKNCLIVSIKISFIRTIHSDSIKNTIDYTILCDILKHCCDKPCELLETIADNILLEIKHRIKSYQSIYISIKKFNPILKHNVQNVFVEVKEDNI
jgi:dihydroneopterin aldolase